MSDASQGLRGKRVATFQTRRGDALSALVRKYGGEPLSCEVLREVELDPNPDAETFADRLASGELDVLVVLTGVGQRRLAKQLSPRLPPEALVRALAPLTIAARGPKAQRALREVGIRVDVVAPEPHTWDGLLSQLEGHISLQGKRVAVQLYGVEHPRLCEGLRRAGAEVWPFHVYTWELPEDTGPAEAVMAALIRGDVDHVLFTSAPQARNLLRIAEAAGLEGPLRQALVTTPVGSVGPSCSEALRELGIEPDFEPEHGKMGHLVREAARFTIKNPT